MAENSLLGKLDGLVSRFEEVGTLITDPAVIADMKRFVKLNKEYRDLEKIVGARSEYVKVLNGIEEAKALLESEQDPEMREKMGIDRFVSEFQKLRQRHLSMRSCT